MKAILLISAIFIMIVPVTVLADVPLIINHQGYVTDDAGVPVNGVRTMTFAIYNVAEGGTALWTEAQSVTVAQGIFNVYLGDVTALPGAIFTGQGLYVGVTIGTDSEMIPRIRLATVPYAFASDQDALPGLKWFRDADDDTFGNRYVWVIDHNQPAGYVPDSTDCRDDDPSIHPGAPEVCDGVDSDCNLEDGYPETCNGLDDDCSGTADDNMISPSCPLQYGVCSGSRMICGGTSGWLPCGAASYGPHYEQTEASCDGLDNDCDGQTDEYANCDDGISCTIDQCIGANCTHTIAAGKCLIDGVCYNSGDKNPANDCQVCNPAVSQTYWACRPDFTVCAPGGYCQGCICVP
jgi:hypothetical protein